jgi:hypothetical protein
MEDVKRHYIDEIWLDPKGDEHEGTLVVTTSPDGIVLDFVDKLGNVLATNGLDKDFLLSMLT